MNQPTEADFRRQIDESRQMRDRRDLTQLRQLVEMHNSQQAMSCLGLRADPYNPCNGTTGRLCMQCPRRNAVALVTSPIPG